MPAHRRLALVCEGGGQRGIFTAGILDSFIAQDYFPFQLLLGSTAEALRQDYRTGLACGRAFLAQLGA